MAWLNRSPSARSRYDEALLIEIAKSFKRATAPMAPRRSGMTSWRKGCPAAFIGSTRLMRRTGFAPGLDVVAFRRIAGSGCCIGVAENTRPSTSRHRRRTRSGWRTSPTSGPPKAGSTLPRHRPVLAAVVGWSMRPARRALVTDALDHGDLEARQAADSLLHHSDQGCQYTSEQFQRLMADHGITCSMSRSGNVWDNSAMESFFSSLKTERTARRSTAPGDAAEPTCSTTSSATTIRGVGHRTGLPEPREFEDAPYYLKCLSTEPAAGQSAAFRSSTSRQHLKRSTAPHWRVSLTNSSVSVVQRFERD